MNLLMKNLKKCLFIAALCGSSAAWAEGVEADNAWVRFTVPGMNMSGAFMNLHNTGSTDDALIAAQSPIAGKVELHDHIDDNGVMRMRAVENIALPAGKTVQLKPGSKHVMFFGLTQTLEPGSSIPLTLQFKHAKPLTLSVPVMKNQTSTNHADKQEAHQQLSH
ncbi:copper chaperone PCu(A)C [Stenoxybacter acetivorans]|uniref:copper chaperone PCu(A)C n=1 Tax=Stenoxybacter acetivorans TaxID=422441 RepID=UPI00068FC7F1|nr:copper chaperone PCu(A)C [Stenoxybacter acetivorans]